MYVQNRVYTSGRRAIHLTASGVVSSTEPLQIGSYDVRAMTADIFVRTSVRDRVDAEGPSGLTVANGYPVPVGNTITFGIVAPGECISVIGGATDVIIHQIG